MGYSRNYLKYWEERSKRKREDAYSRNNEILPEDSIVNPEPPLDLIADIENSFSTANFDHDDEISSQSQPTETVDDHQSESTFLDDSVGSVASRSISSNSILYSQQMYGEQTAVPTKEVCSFQIMRLLDKAGSPRYLYDELMALLRKQVSNNGFDVSEAMSRDAVLKSLYDRFPCPPVEHCRVSNYDVFKFPFVGMLQDLLDSCGSEMHVINKQDQERSIDPLTKSELWNSDWMADTFRRFDIYKNFDTEKEIMLPLILYMDKTGTDALQRYSLEPVLFSTAAIPRETREKDSSWRNLGFIPSLSNTDQNQEETYDQKQLQLYHDCLSVILRDLILAQKNPPTVTVERNGKKIKLKARLPVMIVMGDQKSQDTLCGRKHANSGGAGRVHRSCMCSYLTVDSPSHECVDVCSRTIKRLVQSALTSPDHLKNIASQFSSPSDENERVVIENYLKRQQQMNSQILQYPFTQHAIDNAFDEVDFGAWDSGIFKATFDDFMHSTESGLFEYIATLVFDGLTKTEKHEVETSIRRIFLSTRSSVRSAYPRWRLKDGFSNQTRITCGERVGSILVLALALQYKEIASVVRKGHIRQTQKYITFWSEKGEEVSPHNGNNDHHLCQELARKKSKVAHTTDQEEIQTRKCGEAESQSPFYWERHMPADKMSSQEIEQRLLAMARHGFDLKILMLLDSLQIHSLISHCGLGDCKSFRFPKNDIPNYYKRLGANFKISKALLNKAVGAFSGQGPSDILDRDRFVPIEGTVQKHYRRKPKRKGVGSSAAILTKDVKTFVYFLEYLLCFHAFCRYSFTLPPEFQDNFDLINFGCQTLIRYYEKLVYRGDNTLDSRTTKVHANKRVGLNHKCLRSCMHADCQTGERLLKTKAKSVAATAQQRGNSIFECQSMHRIKDDTVMSKYEAFLTKEALNKSNEQLIDQRSVLVDSVTRRVPNFRYSADTGEWMQLDRKGKVVGKAMINQSITEALFRLEPDLDVYEIHCELKLRDQSRIRATPNYCQTGPWYDFVNVKWDGNPPFISPARCLAFYQKKPSNDSQSQVMALVHSADKRSPGKESSSHTDTLLTAQYYLEYTSSKRPKIYAIPAATIESAVLCFFHDPITEKETLFNASKNGFMAVRPRNEWAYVWFAWNEILQQSNSSTRVSCRKAYVDMGNEHLVRQVKKKLQEYMRQ
jgi:hypothetical protein